MVNSKARLHVYSDKSSVVSVSHLKYIKEDHSQKYTNMLSNNFDSNENKQTKKLKIFFDKKNS